MHSLVLRSKDSTDKINSDLGTVALARPTPHTRCTQALWCELGVRNGGCEVAYVSWQCNSSFQGAPRALRKRQDKPGDELPSAGNWRFRTMPQTCFIWFANEGKKKKIGRYDLNCISTGYKVGLTSMLRNCVSFFFYAMHALLHVVPVHTQSANCSHPAPSQAGTALHIISL